MLNCRVSVRKLPQSLATALTPPKTTSQESQPKKRTGKKQTLEEARANKYCFSCHKWFERPNKLRLHMKVVSKSLLKMFCVTSFFYSQAHPVSEKPFVCYNCDISYYSKSGLRKHILYRCPKTSKSKKTTSSSSSKGSTKSSATSVASKSSSSVAQPPPKVSSQPSPVEAATAEKETVSFIKLRHLFMWFCNMELVFKSLAKV